MSFLPSGFDLRPSAKSDSLVQRIAENVRLALAMPRLQLRFGSSSNFPFGLLQEGSESSRAQTASALTHIAVVCALLGLLASHGLPHAMAPGIHLGASNPLLRYIVPTAFVTGKPSLGRHGGGGENDSAPARRGLLAPLSSMPLAPPRLPHADQVELPVAPAVFDPNAPASTPLVTNLGLPWMNKDTNSAGPGKGHGFGSGDGGGMGDDSGDGAGAGNNDGDYSNVVSMPTCMYCPEPPYSDEARKARLQGTVTLRVLIDAEGRAKRVQVIQGIGMGLDERAIEAVRAWRFAPAKNAQRQAVPSWVTIETRFQLL